MKNTKTIVGAAALLMAHSAMGAVDPKEVDAGPFKFVPTLAVTQKHDDNVFRQAQDEESSSITQLKPTLKFVAEDRDNSYVLAYLGDYGFHSNDSDDNYDDHVLRGEFDLTMNRMNSFDITASYGQVHHDRGEASSEGAAGTVRNEPDEFDESKLDGTWAIGNEGSVFGVEVDAGYYDKEFTNNRDATRPLDRDETRLAGRLLTRLAKTDLFVEYATKDVSYDFAPPVGARRDSDEDRVSVGARWAATARTEGTVRIGRTDKDFDAASIGSKDFTSWNAQIRWSPRTYSHLFLRASNEARETNNVGSFIESSSVSVMWAHGWSDRLNSTVSIRSGQDEYENDPRDDDMDNITLSLDYDFQRWLNVKVSYTYAERDSNDDVFDYEQNVIGVTGTFSL